MSRLYEGWWWAKLTLEDGTITHSGVDTYEEIERLLAIISNLFIEDQRIVRAIPERYID